MDFSKSNQVRLKSGVINRKLIQNIKLLEWVLVSFSATTISNIRTGSLLNQIYILNTQKLCIGNLIIGNMLMLPKRNSGTYLNTAQKTALKTNLFKVQFSEKVIIAIYSLALQPYLTDDSRKVNQIVENCKTKIQQHLGNFLISGRTIFSCTTAKNGKAHDSIIKVESILRGEKYLVILKPVRFVDLSALNSNKASDTFLPLNFLSNLVKNFFKSMKYVSIGKNGKYFNPKSQNILQGSGIILFQGYETKFNICQSGIYLQIESMVRIIQNRTALEEIDSIYSKNSHLNKDEKREAVRQQLIGKVVMANYGNSKIWLIKEIVFDFDLQVNKISQESNMSFVQYYEKNYGIKITKKKQPVFKAVMNGTRKSKVEKDSILIPQFLLLSGLPDDFDERKRRQISQYTIINPDQKMRRIENLISDFNNDKQNFSPNSVEQSLGIKFCPVAENIQAIILPPPVLQLGRGQCIQKQKSACFQLFNKEIYRHDIPVNVVVIIPNDYDFEPIQKLFSSTCKNLCIKYSLNVIRVNFHDTKKVFAQIQKIIDDAQGKFDNFDLNWFVLPPNMKSQYKNIKKLSMKSQNPKVTQIALTSTLGKKGFASILTKILIQISSKIGNVPWAPKLPAALPPKTLLVGVDSCKQSKNNVVAYCATINKDMTKFHSNYLYEPKSNSRLNGRIGEIICDSITAYAKANSCMPEQIIILKAQLSEGEKQQIVTTQINQIKLKLKEMNLCSVKLTYMTANKNSKQKFFAEGRSIVNPAFGTLINNKIVSKNYDFFLISQHCNRGTVKPIHFNVLYTDSKMEQGVLQELMFCQSFNYMNWSGSVRVPSVLQYSTKLCSFVADNINKPPETKELNEHLYFI